MKSYKLRPHVADIRLDVIADSLEELFQAALEGMAHLIKESTPQGSPAPVVELNVQAHDATTLLIDFLSEALTQTHINNAVYDGLSITALSTTSLKATISGTTVDSFDKDIKAVTYHEAEVVQNKQEQYQSSVVLDI